MSRTALRVIQAEVWMVLGAGRGVQQIWSLLRITTEQVHSDDCTMKEVQGVSLGAASREDEQLWRL